MINPALLAFRGFNHWVEANKVLELFLAENDIYINVKNKKNTYHAYCIFIDNIMLISSMVFETHADAHRAGLKRAIEEFLEKQKNKKNGTQ
jgi:hypothetical protein